MWWQRCILVTGDTATIGHQLTQVAFKNFAPFTKCVTNIDGAAIDDAWRFRFSHANVQPNRI